MMNTSKILIVVGFYLIVLGIMLPVVSKISWLGKLPGDIYIEKNNVSFYFPFTTCLLISIIVTFIIRLLFKK